MRLQREGWTAERRALTQRLRQREQELAETNARLSESRRVTRTYQAQDAGYRTPDDLEDMYSPDSEPELEVLPRRPNEDREAYRARRAEFERSQRHAYQRAREAEWRTRA